jgi:hypothetical protein
VNNPPRLDNSIEFVNKDGGFLEDDRDEGFDMTRRKCGIKHFPQSLPVLAFDNDKTGLSNDGRNSLICRH